MKLNVFIGLLISLFLSGCAHSPDDLAAEVWSRQQDRAAEWIYTEPVTYRENHDQSMIWLGDGRELRVRFGKITFEQVQEWKPGRKLTLAYSAAMGCVLVDEETMDQLPVIGGWGDRHPLDLLLKQNLRLDYSTMDIVEAYDASIAHWQAEIDRLYLLYLESGQVPPAAKEAIRAERAAWERFRDAHGRTLNSLYSLPGGTMWEIKGSEHYHALVRDQALRLQNLLEAMD